MKNYRLKWSIDPEKSHTWQSFDKALGDFLEQQMVAASDRIAANYGHSPRGNDRKLLRRFITIDPNLRVSLPPAE